MATTTVTPIQAAIDDIERELPDDGRPRFYRLAMGKERAKRAPGTLLLILASLLLLGEATAQGVVSWRAQMLFITDAGKLPLPAALEAGGLDSAAVIFALLALAKARKRQSAAIERALNLACALGSGAMNILGAHLGSPRSVAVFALPPLLYAATSDRLIAVAGSVAGVSETSLWRVVGRAFVYMARLVLDPWRTACGLRRVVLDTAPLPAETELAALRAVAEERAATAEACLARAVTDHAVALEEARADTQARIETVQARANEAVEQARQQARQDVDQAVCQIRADADTQLSAVRTEIAQYRRDAQAAAQRAVSADQRAIAAEVRNEETTRAVTQARAESTRERDGLHTAYEARAQALAESRAEMRDRADRAEQALDLVRTELARLQAAQTRSAALPKASKPKTGQRAAGTKKAQLIKLYDALAPDDPRHGDRSKVSQVAAELAERAGLQPGTARTYLYEHVIGSGDAA
jgi:hypothetical protein